MSPVETERHFRCPHCWERQTVLLDLSVEGEQQFVQDCAVCCNPIEFGATVEHGELVAFAAADPEQ